jgi:hypothetical protein
MAGLLSFGCQVKKIKFAVVMIGTGDKEEFSLPTDGWMPVYGRPDDESVSFS